MKKGMVITMGIQNDMQAGNVPIGLALGMAMNESAIENFGKMTEYDKEKLIAKSRNVKSKAEMEQLIQKLGEGDISIKG